VGVVKARRLSPSALEDCWQREETRVAIEQARAVINSGAVPPLTPIARLSDVELGWIVAAVVFGWITARARHAVNNGVGNYAYVRDSKLEPDPWDIGAIEAILPELANSATDWSKPLSGFSREDMIAFLGDAYNLIAKAMLLRDLGEQRITCKGPDGEVAEAAPLPF
jgi:hypothetical protein